MAADWIPMRLDIREDPAVIMMADALKVREEVIVGYLHSIWSWLSRQCHDGSVTGVTLSSLGRVTNLSGFPELMRDAGWIIETKNAAGLPMIVVPNWDRWLSKSAKYRIRAAERQRKSRHGDVAKVSRKKRDKGVTTEENSTEENNKKKDIPPSIEEVQAYCKERGGKVDAAKWFDYYTSNGWKVGKNPMKDWKAAVRNWEKSSFGPQPAPAEPEPPKRRFYIAGVTNAKKGDQP